MRVYSRQYGPSRNVIIQLGEEFHRPCLVSMLSSKSRVSDTFSIEAPQVSGPIFANTHSHSYSHPSIHPSSLAGVHTDSRHPRDRAAHAPQMSRLYPWYSTHPLHAALGFAYEDYESEGEKIVANGSESGNRSQNPSLSRMSRMIPQRRTRRSDEVCGRCSILHVSEFSSAVSKKDGEVGR